MNFSDYVSALAYGVIKFHVEIPKIRKLSIPNRSFEQILTTVGVQMAQRRKKYISMKIVGNFMLFHMESISYSKTSYFSSCKQIFGKK